MTITQNVDKNSYLQRLARPGYIYAELEQKYCGQTQLGDRKTRLGG